jgi:ectoine hydroxylase
VQTPDVLDNVGRASAVAASKVADRNPARGAWTAFIDRAEPTIWTAPGAAGPHAADQLARHDRDGFGAVTELITEVEVEGLPAELARLTGRPTLVDGDRTMVESVPGICDRCWTCTGSAF